jgi:hypothetical protein
MTATVVAFVQRLAQGKTDVGYVISSRFTGKREWHWDSRTGEYSEVLPLIGPDEVLIQRVFAKPLLGKRRAPDAIRQK